MLWTAEDVELAMGDRRTDYWSVSRCQDTSFYTDETTTGRMKSATVIKQEKTEMLPFFHWIIMESCALI